MFVNSARSASRFIAVSSLELLGMAPWLVAKIIHEHTSAMESASPVSSSMDAKQGNRPPLIALVTNDHDYTRTLRGL